MFGVVCIALAVGIGLPRPSARISDSRSGLSNNFRRAVAVAGVLAVLVFLFAGRISVVSATAVLAATMMFLWDKTSQNRRQKKTETHTAQLLEQVTSELRAGALLGSAFSRAVKELNRDQALNEDFKRALQHLALQGPATPIDQELFKDQKELKNICRLWAVADTHGLSSADLFEHAAHALRSRIKHRSATSAKLQGAQATAWILSALPIVGIFLGTSMGAHPLALLTSGGIGGLLLNAGVGLICGGLLISQIIIERAAQ